MWRFFAAPATLLILLALLAMALILGTLIPQISPDVSAGPQSWLTLQPEVLSPSNDLARALGLYGIYGAFWFRLLLVLAGLALFVWGVELAELAWRAGRGRWTPSALALWGKHPLRTRLLVPGDPAQVQAHLGTYLSGRGYRMAEVTRSQGVETAPNWVAGRRGALLWARPLTFAGFLLALLGLAIVTTWGWQSSRWQPAAGERMVVGHGTGYSIRLDVFEPLTGDESQPDGGRYESRITWLAGDQIVGQGTARVGQPAARSGLAVRQSGYVPDATIRGIDQAGNPLRLLPGGVTSSAAEQVSLAFGSSETQQVIVLPDQGFFLLLDLEPASDGADPLLRLALLRSAEAEQQPLAVLHQSGTVSFDGLKLDVALGHRPVLQVDYRPGMVLVIAGLVLAIAGLAVGWLCGSRLLWMAVTPGEEKAIVHLLAFGGAGESGWFSKLAAHLQEEMTDAV